MKRTISPDDVPNHLADRGHAQCRNIVDRLVANRPPHDGDDVRAWLTDMNAVIQAVTTAKGGVKHYESILAGVAALAVGRLAAARGGEGR